MSKPARHGGDSPGYAVRSDGSHGHRSDGERGMWDRNRRSTDPGGLRITLKVPPAEPRDEDDDGGPHQRRWKKPRGTPATEGGHHGAGDGESRHRPIPSFLSALSAPSWPEEFGGPAASGVAVGATAAAEAAASLASASDDTPQSPGRRRRFKKEAKRRGEPPTAYEGGDEDDRKPSAVTTRTFEKTVSHVLFQQGVVEPELPPKLDNPVGNNNREGDGQVAPNGGGGGVRRSGRRRRFASRGERWDAKDDDGGLRTTNGRGMALSETAAAAGRNKDDNTRPSRPPPNHVLFQLPPTVKGERREPPQPVHRRREDLVSDPASGGRGIPSAEERWYGGCVPLLQPGDGERLSELQRSIRRHLELFAASPRDVAGGVFRVESSPSGKKEGGDPSASNDNGVEAFRVGIRCVHCRLAASVGAVGGGRYERFEIGTHREYYPTHFYLRDGSFGFGAGSGSGTTGDGGDEGATVTPHLPIGAFSFPESLSTLNGTGVLRHLDHFLSHCPYLPAEERTRLSDVSPSDPGGTTSATDDDHLAELADGIGLVELRGGRGLRFGHDPLLRPAAAGGGGGVGEMVPAVSTLTPDEPMDPQHMDDESLRFFREAVADLRSWSSSGETAAATVPAGRGGMGGPLLRPDDRQIVTDFRFLCFAQLRLIHFEEADLGVRSKQPNLIPIPLGYAGFCCRFCGERSGINSGAADGEGPPSVDEYDTSKKAEEEEYYIADDGRRMKRRPKQPAPPTTGRFFPSSHSSLSGCNDHLYRCRYVPDGLKRCLKALQPLNKGQINRLRKASHARHKVLIWSRLRDADKDVKEDVENPPDTDTGNGDVSHLGTKDAASTSDDDPSEREDTIEDEKAEGGNDGASSAGGKGDGPSSIGCEGGGTGPDDVTQAPTPDLDLLNHYSFVRTPTGWWTCKRCCMVPLDLRSKGCLTMSPPSEKYMRQHLSICLGDRFNMLAAIKAVEGMSQSGIIRVDDIVLPAFRSIVRELVGGHHQLVSVFTYGVRAILKGEETSETIETCGLWSEFPAQVDDEAVTNLLKSLPFSSDDEGRPSCLIVTNNHFRDYVHLLAPGFTLPTLSALMRRTV